jgi:hypothetical protein
LERISQHISYREATRSRTATKKGIDNTPDDDQLEAMKAVAYHVFEPLRVFYGFPIFISSFLRVPKLNVAVGGASNSQHMKGEAIDLDADRYGGITNADIFYYIKENLIFDQIIWEFGDDDNPEWVHVSYKRDGGNRNKVTIAYRKNGRTYYKRWDRD